MHYINVVRKWQTNLSTISEFRTSDGALSGYFLEPPGPDTTTENIRRRIPEGTYNLQWYTSRNLTQSLNPYPLLSNQNVSAGRWILIHHGNNPENTDGCLLAGTTKSANHVGASIPMLNRIKNFLNQKGINNVKVVISSSYQ